jgi:phenylalanyl-tRNA synthetase beta chain
LTWIQARHGIEHDPLRLSTELPLLGTDIGHCDSDTLEVEIFPNRPDLLCAETLAHAIRPFIHGKDAQPSLEVIDGNISLTVDDSLAEVRPVVLGAVVRGVDAGQTEEQRQQFIKGLMEHQEKLHFALGRGRRKASIGVHDLSALAPPFRVITVARDYSFIPLGLTAEMSIEEILTEHPKGIDYAHLLDGMDKVPVIIDANDAVLSFPPIINGDHTTVSLQSTDFFIDVTGWDERTCEACLQLICLQLSARGGMVETVHISPCSGDDFSSPDPTPLNHQVTRSLVSNILGWNFTDDQLSAVISRMGGKFLGGDEMLQFAMPRWRFDILHPIDIVEDLAIGHGYDDLGSSLPETPMSGEARPDAMLNRRVRECLQGLGLQQVQSLTLSHEADQFANVRWKPVGESTIITNPITTEHTMLRQSIIPSLLRLIASNRHHELPQCIYESGYCVRDHKNISRVAWLVADHKAGFSRARGFTQILLRDLGADSTTVTWEVVEAGEGPWLAGRGARIKIDDRIIGEFGEVDPVVSEKFELSVPMHGGEFDLEALLRAIPDPVL